MKRGVGGLISVLAMLIAKTAVFGQYQEGQVLSQETRDLPIYYCANGLEATTLGELLLPESGKLNHVLWINFFSSW